jgi:DNA-directed RNA polymerase subunit RPC12/RpoP
MSNIDLLAHFPTRVSDDLVRYIENVVLLHSRYLFVSRHKRIQFAYCTHCRRSFMTPNTLMHNDLAECQKCGSRCTVKHAGRGRKSLKDEAYVVWYEKSRINPRAIIAQGIHVIRDYSEDYKTVETKISVVAKYVFIPGDGKGRDRFGQAHMLRRFYHYNNKFTRARSVYSELDHAMCRPPFYLDPQNIASAVSGTPFQYSGWEQFLSFREEEEYLWYSFRLIYRRQGEPRTDLVKFFALAAKYPCVEYLVKLGLKDLVSHKIDGLSMYKAVNWRGTTAQKVLRVSVREIRDMQAAGQRITPRFLRSYQLHRNIVPDATMRIIHMMEDLVDLYNHPIKNLTNLGITYPQIVRYALKQFGLNRKSRWFSSPMNVVRDWCDYLNDCQTLEMDITSDRIRFPKNLHKAHQETMKKVQIKKDQRVNQMIRKRLKLLNRKYRFECGGFLIRPAASTEELIQEGNKLSHCVGRYAERYSRGECDILFVRRIDDPDKPFYTMEISDGRIVQCRGRNNCTMTPEVQAFVDTFRAERLDARNRNKKTVRQEVAV